MSANNWAECPRCIKVAKENDKKRLKHIQDSYGKIREEEYLKLLKTSNERLGEVLAETLREDYCIGICEDKFEVSYFGSCKVCGFKKEFKKTERLEI